MVKTPIPLKKASAEHAPQASSAATSHSQAVETGASKRKTTIKKRVKQSLIVTTVAGMLVGIALTVWIVNRTNYLRVLIHCIFNIFSDCFSGNGHTVCVDQSNVC